MKAKSIIAGAVVALVLVGGGALFLKTRTKAPAKPVVVDKVLEEDKKNLAEGSGANEYQVYAAMVRLAQAGDDLAVKEAFKRASAESEWVRAGAADALGRSTDANAAKLLRQFLQDKSVVVRLQTLKALGYRTSDENISLIKTYLERKDLTDKEKIQARFSLVRIVPFPERKKLVEEMVTIASGQQGDDRIASWLEIVSLAPREDAVLEKLEGALRAGNDEELESLAIRHMSASAPDRIRGRIFAYHNDKRPKVRLAAVQSLPTACPIERMTILSNVIDREKESIVWRTAVQTAGMMPSDKTLALLKTVKSRKVPDDDAKYVDDSIRMIEANRGPDPCEPKATAQAPKPMDKQPAAAAAGPETSVSDAAR